MSFMSWLRRAFAPSNDFWYYPLGGTTSSGVRVTEESALKFITVYSCVSLIAGDIARLPLNLYRKRKDGGKDTVTDHQLYDLLHNAPNPDTTSFNFRETLQSHLLLWGNAYCFIDRSNGGQVKALWQLPDPGAVDVSRSGGQLRYTYMVNGREVSHTRDKIFHVPGLGYNGMVGMSMISVAREAIGLGVAAEQFGSKYFGEGTHPSGVLEMDRTLGDNRESFAKSIKEGYAGLGKSHKIMILENGMKYKPMTVPLNDAQFMETRAFQKTEICGMYHVPVHKIGVHGQNSNYNNLEQENASYVDSCLMHWLVRWESAISQQLLTKEERMSGLFFEFQVQGLLRGDSAARADYYNKLFQVGAMSPNKILSLENQNPIPGGDQHFVMLNMVPLDMAREMAEPVKPEEKPDEEDVKKQEIDASTRFFKPVNENRSIQIRDRIARQYEPLIRDAAQAVITKETKAIQYNIGKNASIKEFLKDFYRTFPEYVNQKMSPVLRSYMLSIIDAANTELSLPEEDFDTEIKDYIDSYVRRHVESSQGQLTALAEEEPDVIDQRANEWYETRADKITMEEKTRASGAAYSFVAFAAGLSLIWRIRGPETCPYCTELNGKRVVRGQGFVTAGDELDPKGGTGPMKFYGLKQHPPIHQGCDCYVSAG